MGEFGSVAETLRSATGRRSAPSLPNAITLYTIRSFTNSNRGTKIFMMLHASR
jgi:hypothetical protein